MPLAASAAACALDAITVRLTGMPYADKMALDSISVRIFSCALETLVDEGSRLPRIDLEFVRQAWRRLLQEFQIAGIRVHVHESIHCLFGSGKGGNARLIEYSYAGFHVPCPHPYGHEGLVPILDLGSQGLGHSRRVRHGLRG